VTGAEAPPCRRVEGRGDSSRASFGGSTDAFGAGQPSYRQISLRLRGANVTFRSPYPRHAAGRLLVGRRDALVIPEQFGRVAFLLMFSLAFPALPLAASYLFYKLKLRPEHPNPVKEATYECGVESEGSSWGQFHARYYLFALGFVIFDVEVIFLYPWAVNHAAMGVEVLFKAAIFIGILAFGLAYAWRKRALEWR